MTVHMLLHVLLMNVAAPAFSYGVRRAKPDGLASRLWLATAAQLALLWLWHAPPSMALVHSSSLLAVISHAALFFVAVWFWLCVIGADFGSRWHALIALLVTGKLVCLLAILLLFAPRAIYAVGHVHGPVAESLLDQQTAGLIMLIACPLTYVATAVFFARRWLDDAARLTWRPREESLLP